MANDRTLFARGTASCPIGGKCTEEIKTHAPLDLKEKLTALAVLNNQTTAEYVRDVLLLHVYGSLEVIKARQGAGRAGIGPDEG